MHSALSALRQLDLNDPNKLDDLISFFDPPKGHEIAAHSITHSSNEKYWSEASVEQWAKEMAGVGLANISKQQKYLR